MSGTPLGGARARDTNNLKTEIKINYIDQKIEPGTFYRHIGAQGGRNGHTGGFYKNRELASEAGRKGGKISRRGPPKARGWLVNDEQPFTDGFNQPSWTDKVKNKMKNI